MRKERDSLGVVNVPSAAKYGSHTTRSVHNFSVLNRPLPLEIIYSIALLKIACAKANTKLNLLPKSKAEKIIKAANAIIDGKHDTQFPIDVLQAGSGTSSHMNVNEVIAHLAHVHPNDDVNKGQSTNNIFPSALKISSYNLSYRVIDALDLAIKTLKQKAKEFGTVKKAARTHLQDAVPITLGQEFNAYATALSKSKARIEHARKALLNIGAGGSAVGTGVNTPPKFRQEIIKHLCKLTNTPYTHATDGVEATQFLTDLAAYVNTLCSASQDLVKICNDLKLLASGPRTGINELHLPGVEPGSSIMPGKVNPSICESAIMASLYIQGLNHSVQMANQLGQLELNTHMPLVGNALVESSHVFTNALVTVSEKCLSGITVNKKQCETYLEESPSLATLLNPVLGYDKVAVLVKESVKTGKTLKTLALEKGLLTKKEYDRLVESSTKPNIR